MINRAFLIAVAASSLSLAACFHDEESSAKAPPCVASNLPTGQASTVSGDSMRVTLKGDGTISKIEGTNGAGLWEDARLELTSASPSQGACVQRIEIYALNDDPSVLVDAEGHPSHQHSGPNHPQGAPHCHRLYAYQGKTVLVHC